MEPFSLLPFQVPRPAGGTSTAVVTSSSSHLVQQQTPPTSLRGVSSGYRSSVEYNASRMKGVFVPASSPYDVSPSSRSHSAVVMGDRGGQAENHPLIGGSMDAVDDKQVKLTSLVIIMILFSISWFFANFCFFLGTISFIFFLELKV